MMSGTGDWYVKMYDVGTDELYQVRVSGEVAARMRAVKFPDFIGPYEMQQTPYPNRPVRQTGTVQIGVLP